MVRIKCLILVSLIPLALRASAGSAAPQQPRSSTPRAALLRSNPLTSVEWARTAVACLLDEVRRPGEGRFTDCSSVHARELQSMLLYLGHDSVRDRLDRTVIREALHQAQGEARDVLILLLGIAGDREAAPAVASYAADLRKPPYLRLVAVEALQYIRDPRAVKVLLTLMENDPSWERRSKQVVSGGGNSVFKAFIVRQAAQLALQAYGRDNLLDREVEVRVERAPVTQEITTQELRALVDAEANARSDAEVRAIRAGGGR